MVAVTSFLKPFTEMYNCKENFQDYVLKQIPIEWNDYDVILGEEMIINNWKFSKIFKHAPRKFLMNPLYKHSYMRNDFTC